MFLGKFLRIERGLSQAKLARLTGIDQPTISNIERGRTNPNERERQALARVLGCTPDRLLAAVDVQREGSK